MKIESIYLKNFKNFAEKEIEVHDITFFQGSNGSGKTTLALESILFALYGYTPKEKLADLPTRDKAKSCTVTIKIEDNKNIYTITRKYPTDLIIKKNDELIKFATTAEAGDYIVDLFGSRLNFMRFRIVDAYDKEADLLGLGPSSIKKIIFGFYEDLFNKAKTKLQDIKSERERLSKDNAVIYTHYPSEKRLDVLNREYTDLLGQYSETSKEINNFESDFVREEREKATLEGNKSQYTIQKNKLLANSKCYVCGQGIEEEKRKALLEDVNKNILELNNKIKTHMDNLAVQKDIIEDYKKTRESLQGRKDKLTRLKMRLEARMQQKNLIYDKSDVLVVKQALDELDKLSSYYLAESVRVLEPIINSILDKISFKVRFTLDDKGRFTITLQKEDIIYKYKDLSTGQKLLLQIAFKLAMLMQNNETGLIIADEGMSSLDSENLKHVLTIFENYPFQLLFVIHHLEEIPDSIKLIDLNKGE